MTLPYPTPVMMHKSESMEIIMVNMVFCFFLVIALYPITWHMEKLILNEWKQDK